MPIGMRPEQEPGVRANPVLVPDKPAAAELPATNGLQATPDAPAVITALPADNRPVLPGLPSAQEFSWVPWER